jgi:spermidine/putrescine-binding protein
MSRYDGALMRELRFPILIVILVSFALGIYWGIQLQRERAEALGIVKFTSTLKVLAPRGVIPPKLLRNFQVKSSIKIQLEEYDSPEYLDSHDSELNKFDVVLMGANQASIATSQGRLRHIDAFKSLSNFKSIHPDFFPATKDPGLHFVAPILWIISGYHNPNWKYVTTTHATSTLTTGNITGAVKTPSDSTVWILAIVLPRDPKDSKDVNDADYAAQSAHSTEPQSALKLVNWLLEPESGLQIALKAQAATTLSTLENSTQLTPELKPSFLRSFSLSKIKLAN